MTPLTFLYTPQAIGSKGEILPDNICIPMSENYGGSTYFVLETHYDNPALEENFIDNSGMKFFYTDQVREHDSGMFFIGVDPSPFTLIPPYQENFGSLGRCTAGCTEGVKFGKSMLCFNNNNKKRKSSFSEYS